jgi:hypothetical protein
MATTTTPEVNPPLSDRSTEELRAKMYRLIDELATARSDRASAVKAEFEALWKKLPGGEGTTLH